jgi:FdhD protein
LNDINITTIACLDDKLKDLGIGFLSTEGILRNLDEVEKIELCNKRTRLDIKTTHDNSEILKYLQTVEKTTGCGGGISGSTIISGSSHFIVLPLSLSSIPDLMVKFQGLSTLFIQTGGVHSAALVKDDEINFFAEDIGRHNAVDKVIGSAFLGGRNIKEFYLLTSGRISSEIVRKAIRLDIPLILSQAAPTSRAISLAWQYGVYLIGFARGRRFNIYTGIHQVEKLISRNKRDSNS